MADLLSHPSGTMQRKYMSLTLTRRTALEAVLQQEQDGQLHVIRYVCCTVVFVALPLLCISEDGKIHFDGRRKDVTRPGSLQLLVSQSLRVSH